MASHNRQASETGTQAPDVVDTTQLATQLFEHVQGQINFADTKAQLTLAADALLAAVVAPQGRSLLGGLLDGSAPPLTRIAALLGLLMFASVLLSVYFALVVARPMLRVGGARPSLFYFGTIVQHSEEEFIKAFVSQSSEDVRLALLAQVHARAKIAWRKFTAIQRSLDFLVAALVLWTVAQVLLALVQ